MMMIIITFFSIKRSAIGRFETERDYCFGHLLPILTAVRRLFMCY